MFKFIKFLLIGTSIFGFAYFVFMVPLGEKTFWGHLVGIKQTEEAKELEVELEKKVMDAADDVASQLKKRAADMAKSDGGSAPGDGKDPLATSDSNSVGADHSGSEKRELGKLIQAVAEPSKEEKEALSKLINDKTD